MRERRDTVTPENARVLAQRSAEKLGAAFADQDARLTINGDEVRLEIPCPSPAVDKGLWILCEGPEGDVIVGFHTQHTHFGPWDEYTDQHVRMDAIVTALDDGIALAREFLEERQIVISWYSTGWCPDGSAVTATRDVPERAVTDVHEGAKKIFTLGSRIRRVLNRHTPHFGRVTATVRSWNGTYDADPDDVR
jgi:hypothetical protein